MNKLFRRRMSLLLAVLLALSLMGTAPVLAEEYFPEDSIVSLSNESLGLGGEEEGEQTIVGSLNCAEGTPQAEGPDTSTAFSVGEEEETLGAGHEEVNPDGYMSAPSGMMNDSLGNGGDMSAAAPSITLSSSSLSVKKGDTSTITVKVSGYSGSVYMFYGTDNTTSYTCTWGSWSGSSIPLRIKGNSLGSGTVTLYMVAVSSGQLLTTKALSVKVISPDNPTLKLSSTSVDMYVGDSKKITATASGYSASYYLSFSIDNSSVVGGSWDSKWSGSSIGLTLTGKAGGKTKVTVYMRASSTGSELAKATITVNVNQKNPTLTLSKSSVTMKVSDSQKVTATVGNASGSYSLSYSIGNSSICRCTWDSSWSGSSIGLTLTGLNAGSTTVTVSLKNSSGTKLDSKTISVKLDPKPDPQEVIVTPTSVSVKKGATYAAKVTWKNLKESAYLQYSTTNTSAYDIKWGSLTSNSYPLNITGKAKGSGKITVYLKRKSDDKILSQKSISVEVIDNKPTIQDVGFGFQNYTASISYDVFKYMFGNTQTAQQLYYYYSYANGVCFGMATGASLLHDNSNAPYTSYFKSNTELRQLSKSDYSSTLGLSLTQFVQANYITQFSPQMTWVQNKLDQLVSTCKKELDAGRTVGIGMTCSSGGHEVLAYDYEQVSSTQFDLLIYDSNYVSSPSNMKSTRMTFKKSSSSGSYTSWSYPLSSSTTWGSNVNNANVDYTTYDIILKVWNNRGKLANKNVNLFSTKESNFSVYQYDDNMNEKLVARYENGQLVEHSDDVYEVHIDHLLPGSEGERIYSFYAPSDLYKVVDGTPNTPMEMMMSDDLLSVKIDTESDTFDLCADSRSDAVNAILNPTEGMPFAVTLGSSREGDPDEITIEGLGTGNMIGISLNDGELSISGADAASLSITNYDVTYTIEAVAGEGGSISPEGASSVVLGSNVVYTITPDEGYAIRKVYVDGEDMGAISEYHFDSVDRAHSIYAEFTRDLNTCALTLSNTSFVYDGAEKRPQVTVKSPDGRTLVENMDFDVSYENNIEVGTATVYVTALPDSPYNGLLTATFTIGGQANAITSAVRNNAANTVTVKFNHEGAALLVAAVYDADGRMVGVITNKAAANTDSVTFTFKGISLVDVADVKIMLLNDDFSPLCGFRLAN